MHGCQTHDGQQSPRIAGCKFHNGRKGSSPPGAVHGVTEHWVVVASSWQNEDKRKQRTLLKERVLPQDHLSICEGDGRGERIRTSDSCVPNAVLYQAELHPDGEWVLLIRISNANGTNDFATHFATVGANNAGKKWPEKQ